MARNGNIILARGIGMDKEHKNIINYTSTSMLQLLRSQNHFVGEKSDYSFISENGKGGNVIATNFTYQECKNANYIAFQNPTYYNKWIFAFIDEVTYENNGCTKITFTVDNWATWFDNLTFKSCFVVREHVNSDNFGEHTIPEGLETGEYINCLAPVEATYDENSYVCVGVTEDALSQSTANVNPTYGGVASGLKYLIVENSFNLWRLISAYASSTTTGIDAIHEVFMIPASFYPNPSWIQVDTNFRYSTLPESTGASFFGSVSFQRNNQIGLNYTPKNKKLFSYPYSYLLVSNNAGTDVIYHYEDFAGQDALVPTINFDILATPSPGCSIKIVPLDYKNYIDGTRNRNYEYSIMGAKYPIGGWIGDVYTNWLTQNSVNLGLSLLNTGIDALTGIEQGSLSKELTASRGILNTMASIYEHQRIPNSSSGNSGASDVMFGLKKLAPTFYRMSIKDEYAKIIDDYFTRFGYKVNSLKVPNITGRTYFNYVEIGAGEDIAFGTLPVDAMEDINNIFRRGTTIWHNHDNIGNFSLDNSL